MGIFGKSEEEKKRDKQTKLEQEQAKIQEAIKYLGIDFDAASDDELKDSNKRNAFNIKLGMPTNLTSELIVNAALGNYERLSLTRLDSLIYQNWILIRQNELIARQLKKIFSSLK